MPDTDPPHTIGTVMSFAKALRANQSEVSLASSVYSSRRHEPTDDLPPVPPLPSEYRDVWSDVSAVTPPPRVAALATGRLANVMTQKGKVLCSDGRFRMPEAPVDGPAGFANRTGLEQAESATEGATTRLREVKTGKGTVLDTDSNSSREAEIHGDPAAQAGLRTSADCFPPRPRTSRVVHLSTRAQVPADRLALARLEGCWEGSDDSPPHYITSQKAASLDRLSRAECMDQIKEHHDAYHERIDWGPLDDIACIRPRSASAEVTHDDYTPSASSRQISRAGGRVLHRLSQKVKAAWSRGASEASKPRISGPVQDTFVDFDPRAASPGAIHPQIKAIPLAEAQRRFLQRAPLQISAPLDDFRRVCDSPEPFHRPEEAAVALTSPAPELRQRPTKGRYAVPSIDRYPHALKAKASKAKRPARPLLAAGLRLAPGQRVVEVVGSASRETCFEDFIRAAVSHSTADLNSSPEQAAPGTCTGRMDKPLPPLPADAEAPPSASRVAVPKRKPVALRDGVCRSSTDSQDSRVDSHHTAPTPTQRTLEQEGDNNPTALPPLPHKLSSMSWRTYTSNTSLYPTIEEQILPADIPEDRRSSMMREARRLEVVFDRPALGSVGVQDDGEPAITLDTFVREGHTSWVGTQRANSRVICSDHRRFVRDRYEDEGDA